MRTALVLNCCNPYTKPLLKKQNYLVSGQFAALTVMTFYMQRMQHETTSIQSHKNNDMRIKNEGSKSKLN